MVFLAHVTELIAAVHVISVTLGADVITFAREDVRAFMRFHIVNA